MKSSRFTYRPAIAVAIALVVLAAVAAVALASPPSGVTPTVLARGTYDAFKVRPSPHSPVDFKAKTKGRTDIVVRRHDYAIGSSTGWHSHPGPVFITVTLGEVTFYERDDRTCTPHVVSAGHGYVDTGQGHIGRNESGQPAQDISVIIAPVGGAFRGELDAPSPNCGF
jgi:quercetin dioxygenase-like cupin family protein